MATSNGGFDVVTGAFGYTGRYIARRLLAQGRHVITLTNRPQPSGIFPLAVRSLPPSFDDPTALTECLRGADTLYNTYWIRFSHGATTFQEAVQRSRNLFAAAREAGVRRIVHLSIANADAASPLPYYRGKGEVEEALRSSGVSYAILRPTLVFGLEDILVNNIAWFLRRFPLFGLPGSGDYPVRPVYVDDVAKLAVRMAQVEDNITVDALGPETYTFAELVRQVAKSVSGTTRLVRLPPRLAHLVTSLVGLYLRDVVLTWDEVEGMMAGLLTSDSVPTCEIRFSEWVGENGALLGREYRSELQAHYR